MAKVAFVHNVNSSWVDRDRQIISDQFEVKSVFLDKALDTLALKSILSVLKSSVIYFWFGSLHFLPLVLLARLFGKKVIIVSGGYDVADVPHIKYGAFATGNSFSKALRRLMFSLGHTVLCVSESNRQDTIKNAGVPENKCRLVYHGFELPNHDIKPWKDRKDKVVMISRANKDTFLLKGINYFISLAQSIPQMNFVLMGDMDQYVQEVVNSSEAENLKTTGFLKFRGEEFNRVLNDSKFVLMLSEYESFGCAIVDGAVSGCYPISTDSYALKEVTKDIGSVIRHGNIEQVKEEILSKLYATTLDSKDISARALAKFPLEKRSQGITQAIKELLK